MKNIKNDISIHFTTKGQSVNEIDSKMNEFFKVNDYPFDFSESTTPRSVLHHCFLKEEDLPALKLPPETVEIIESTLNFLGEISEYQVRWKGSSLYGLVWDRNLMLENLAKLKGTSIFIGEIKESVEEELKIAQELGIEIILIP